MFSFQSDLVAQTTSLQERGNTLERREELVKEFLKRYQLSPEQSEALEIGKRTAEIKVIIQQYVFYVKKKQNFLVKIFM